MRPAGATAVTVLAFCNFESPHCARLQVTLAQVLPLFPGVVRYAERTLPLEYHRHAAQAAEAAHCALEQGNYWRYHDVLYAGGNAPDRPVLERAARASDLEPRAFAACLSDGRHAKDVTCGRCGRQVVRRVDRARCVRQRPLRQPRRARVGPRVVDRTRTRHAGDSVATARGRHDCRDGSISAPTRARVTNARAGTGAACAFRGAGARCRLPGGRIGRDRHCRTAHRRRWHRTTAKRQGGTVGFRVGVRAHVVACDGESRGRPISPSRIVPFRSRSIATACWCCCRIASRLRGRCSRCR